MGYILPNKDLLEERSSLLDEDKKYYSLSKLTFKKDLDKKLLFPIGINSEDKYYVDLEEKTSMLILGETGSGKSNLLNTIVISYLLKNTPDELKFIFVDPRGVEFNAYNTIPHLLKPVITDTNRSIEELKEIKKEMYKRRDLFVDNMVKTISVYNEMFEDKIPHIVVIIDEFSDLLNYKNFEHDFLELITDGYRYGIHIIMTTNANLKNKLSTFFITAFNYVVTYDLALKEQADYIKIDEADLLTIYGEALVKSPNHGLIDLQTPYVSDNDITNIVNFINKQ